MFERCRAYFAHPFRLPAAVRSSLSPTTEQEALRVRAQVDYVIANVKRLDYALPLAGCAIIFVHNARAPFMRMAMMLAVVMATVVFNEAVLLRWCGREEDAIASVAQKSRICRVTSAFARTIEQVLTSCSFA